MAMRKMADPETRPRELARRLGVSTLYQFVNGDGTAKEAGHRIFAAALQT